MNLKLDTPPMKKKQQFKSDKGLLKSKQTSTVYSSSMKAREWSGEANEFRGLFTNEDDFGEFSSAEVPGTSHASGFTHVQSYVQNVSGSQSQDTPAEYKPGLVPSQTQSVYNPVAPVSGTSPMPSVNQNPIMSSQLLHPIQNMTAVHSVEVSLCACVVRNHVLKVCMLHVMTVCNCVYLRTLILHLVIPKELFLFLDHGSII